MTQDEDISDIIDIAPENIVEAKPEDTQATAAAPKRNYARYGIFAALMLGSAGLGGWLYRDVLANYLPSEQIQAMVARVDALDAGDKVLAKKLDAVVGLTDELKSQLAAAQSAAEEARNQVSQVKPELADTQSKMAALEKSLADSAATVDALKNNLGTGGSAAPADTPALTARVEKLEQELASLKMAGAVVRPDAAQLSQALDALKTKVTSGASYQDEIGALRKMVPAADGLDVLSANADKGVLTIAALADGMKQLAANMPKPDNAPASPDDSWWGRTSSLLSGLVSVRDVGAVDWQQLATQCAGLMGKGKLADAVKLLEQHMEQLPQAMQDWRILAAKRLAVDHGLEQASSAVAREIAARG